MKRGIDLVAAATGLVVLSPLLGLIGVVNVWYHGWPPIFRQRRPGRDGRVFTIFKFRTMTNETDANGVLLPDARRLTRFGQFLRSSSLDELPELWNVLKGDMSLVGPRPLLVQYLPLYSPRQARRHEVRPGITGWAQVNGRNACSWEEKFEHDVWYVDNWSLGVDLKIVAKTLAMVVKREGISAAGDATMPEFRGTGAPVNPDAGSSNQGPGDLSSFAAIA